MGKLKKNSIVILICFVSLVLFSCSKDKSDFILNLSASITEEDEKGSIKLTKIYYNNMGNGASDDGVFGTTDDDVHRYYVIRDKSQTRSADNETEIVEYRSPGIDGEWFTEDDDEYFSGDIKLREENRHFSEISFFAGEPVENKLSNIDVILNDFKNTTFSPGGYSSFFAGFDAEVDRFFDFKNEYYLSNYNIYNDPSNAVTSVFNREGETFYVNRFKGFYYFDAEDNNWTISSYYTKSRNDSTGEVTTLFYDSPGKDNIWFNEDDLLRGYVIETESNSPKVITRNYYDSKGDDQVWLTGDDFNEGRLILTYDDDGHFVSWQRSSSGADGIVDSEDDIERLSFRQEFLKTEDELFLVRKYVQGFGLETETISQVYIEKYDTRDGGMVLVKAASIEPYWRNDQYIFTRTNDNGVIREIKERKSVGIPSSIGNLDEMSFDQIVELLDLNEGTESVETETKITTPISLNQTKIVTTRVYWSGLISESTEIKISR